MLVILNLSIRARPALLILISHLKNQSILDLYKKSVPAFPCYNTWQVAMEDVFCSVSLALFEVKIEGFWPQGKRF